MTDCSVHCRWVIFSPWRARDAKSKITYASSGEIGYLLDCARVVSLNCVKQYVGSVHAMACLEYLQGAESQLNYSNEMIMMFTNKQSFEFRILTVAE